MKRIYIYMLPVVLLAVSCTDFLQKEPISQLTEKMLGIDPNASKDSAKYTESTQIENLLISAYNDFASEYYQLDYYCYNEGQSDNAYSGEDKVQTRSLDEYNMDSNNGTSSRDWKYLYTQIAKTNSVIQYAPQIKNMNDTRRKQVIAEASLIRAWSYFHLVRIYGDVPLVLQEVPSISSENIEDIYPLLYPERKPAEEIYTQIFKDLEVALTHTPDYSADKFKATKPLAHALLAEVYATYNAPNAVNWAKVSEHAAAVTSDSRYSLLPNYDDLFAPREDKGGLLYEHGPESLFEVQYDSWSTLGNWAVQMFTGEDWKKFNTPSKDLVKAFDDAGDKVRKRASIIHKDVSGKWQDSNWDTKSYPFGWKLRLEEKGNIVLVRLASVILLHAEAENELGNTTGAITLLNKVRNRAKLPNTTATGQVDVRKTIALERRLELAFEGYRWFDLKRTAMAIQTMQSCTDRQKDFAISNLNSNRLLWPIPQTERDKNSKLTQNPGY